MSTDTQNGQPLGQGHRLLIRRMAAYGVDIGLLFIILAPLGFLLQWLFGIPQAQTGPEIGRTLVWNFSIPVWLYFMVCDTSPTGATIGKRLLGLQVKTLTGDRIGIGRAVVRTGVKLLPWELVHLSAFALSTDLNNLNPLQVVGLSAANLFSIAYLVVAAVTRGRRSVHDFLVGTFLVRR